MSMDHAEARQIVEELGGTEQEVFDYLVESGGEAPKQDIVDNVEKTPGTINRVHQKLEDRGIGYRRENLYERGKMYGLDVEGVRPESPSENENIDLQI